MSRKDTEVGLNWISEEGGLMVLFSGFESPCVDKGYGGCKEEMER